MSDKQRIKAILRHRGHDDLVYAYVRNLESRLEKRDGLAKNTDEFKKMKRELARKNHDNIKLLNALFGIKTILDSL